MQLVCLFRVKLEPASQNYLGGLSGATVCLPCMQSFDLIRDILSLMWVSNKVTGAPFVFLCTGWLLWSDTLNSRNFVLCVVFWWWDYCGPGLLYCIFCITRMITSLSVLIIKPHAGSIQLVIIYLDSTPLAILTVQLITTYRTARFKLYTCVSVHMCACMFTTCKT